MSSAINAPLLRKVMEHIETSPEEWDQSMWVQAVKRVEYSNGVTDIYPLPELPRNSSQPPAYCGTAFCFAGHTAYMSGWEPYWMGKSYDLFRMRKDGEVDMVHEIAKEALGLNSLQAEMLFNASNELEDLRYMVDYLASQAE